MFAALEVRQLELAYYAKNKHTAYYTEVCQRKYLK